ncbi:MAG: pilus assembly protein [Kiritimatiellae bacterium]|nr:pilus assembly protein [Kiritimatiellia bacterium]
MKSFVIVDAGPLVAFVNARDSYHGWTVERLKEVAGPMLTCESAVSEALFLLRAVDGGVSQIAGLLTCGGLRIGLSLAAEAASVCRLLTKYADVPMSLADACLVRMSEMYGRHKILTLDGHFRIYRRRRNQILPLLIPDQP